MGETAETEDELAADGPLTVKQLNERIDEIIDSSTALQDIRCIGEVMNVSESDVALYFTLTDGEYELSCVVWQGR